MYFWNSTMKKIIVYILAAILIFGTHSYLQQRSYKASVKKQCLTKGYPEEDCDEYIRLLK